MPILQKHTMRCHLFFKNIHPGSTFWAKFLKLAFLTPPNLEHHQSNSSVSKTHPEMSKCMSNYWYFHQVWIVARRTFVWAHLAWMVVLAILTLTCSIVLVHQAIQVILPLALAVFPHYTHTIFSACSLIWEATFKYNQTDLLNVHFTWNCLPSIREQKCMN